MNVITSSHAKSPLTYRPLGLCSSLAISTINISITAFYGLRLALSLITKKPNREFKLLMHYHLCKSSSLTAWYVFGKNLIYPSINIEKKDSLIQPIQKEKFDKIFQKADLLSTLKLKYKKRSSGVCLGASMNFIKNYLREEQAGLNSKDAFAITAARHSNGITEKTCIKQGIPPHITYSNFASLFKLKYITCMENFNINNKEQLLQKLSQLPFAVYEVTLGCSNKNKTKHSIVLIKNENNFMVYDSNFGSAIYSINKGIKTIQKIIKFYRYNSLSFSHIILK